MTVLKPIHHFSLRSLTKGHTAVTPLDATREPPHGPPYAHPPAPQRIASHRLPTGARRTRPTRLIVDVFLLPPGGLCSVPRCLAPPRRGGTVRLHSSRAPFPCIRVYDGTYILHNAQLVCSLPSWYVTSLRHRPTHSQSPACLTPPPAFAWYIPTFPPACDVTRLPLHSASVRR